MNNPDVIGIGEIADLFGVSKQVVSNWKTRDSDFPDPIVNLKSGPIWLREQIQMWAKEKNIEMRSDNSASNPRTNECKTIALCNMKGGVGKSTLTANLGWYCAYKQNLRVLLIDLDPQFNLSQYVLGNAKYEALIDNNCPTIVDIFEQHAVMPSGVQKKKFNSADTIAVVKKWSDGSYIHIIPSKLELAWTLKNHADKQYLLKYFIEDLRDNYDLILIDCPPTESMLTTAAYLASDYLLIPVRPEFLSTIGLPLLVRSLEDFKIKYKKEKYPEIAGIIFNDSSEKLEHDRSRIHVEKVAKEFGWYVFQNQISHSDSYAAGARVGKPIFLTDYARMSKVQEFYNLAQEFLTRINQ